MRIYKNLTSSNFCLFSDLCKNTTKWTTVLPQTSQNTRKISVFLESFVAHCINSAFKRSAVTGSSSIEELKNNTKRASIQTAKSSMSAGDLGSISDFLFS